MITHFRCVLTILLLAESVWAWPQPAPRRQEPGQPVCSLDFGNEYLGRIQCDGNWYIHKDLSYDGICDFGFCRIELQNDPVKCHGDNDPVTRDCYNRMVAAQKSNQGIQNQAVPSRTSK